MSGRQQQRLGSALSQHSTRDHGTTRGHRICLQQQCSLRTHDYVLWPRGGKSMFYFRCIQHQCED
ncbi:hypothetical protein GLYMA_10G024800v4 [Glycine max]|uniref:Uncharacterized protein n=1 Tax=Glycine max TaxID=3847 RepID=K7LH05_SOYBN|nr:hypothetical protein JHK87_026611 [Glycine soja]KAG5002711.1 hypothetical protein JHK86_026850 [Glycine max]KAG5150486.1 hypothetical protein JHK84_026958 [Glycine max]KAH1136397.1 hypothetical protein GYH30_026747 [Glycine max]KRH31993.1 hypothetical protein GLYMA_10G024800v4 [Glycine max]